MNNKSVIPAGGASPLSPEDISLSNMYFEMGMDARKTAMALSIPLNKVIESIKAPALSSYISTVLLEQGYMNRGKLFSTLDNIIEKKMEEMEENEMGSGKDIIDILALTHKMRMEEMSMQLKLQELEIKRNSTTLRAGNVNVVNVNNPSGQSGNLGNLLNGLLRAPAGDIIDA